MKSLNKILSVALIALIATASASAARITGDIFFSGSVLLGDGAGNNASVAAAKEFKSFTNVQVAEGTQTGDYASVPDHTAVTMNGFVFDPALSPAPLNLWSFSVGLDNYWFVLDTVTDVLHGVTTLGIPTLEVAGKGWASATGYDDAAGVWAITLQGNTANVSFSSVTSVPDSGATLALLGLGLVGVASVARRTRR